MKIGIGCDEVAYSLKMIVIKHLEEKGIEVVDFGCGPNEKVLYPDVALAVAQDIAAKKFERGILICGTGIGMAITANKVPGVRAACCHDVYSAERSRKSNDAHILTMGAQVIGYSLALMLVDAWLASEYAGGRSQPKVDRMIEIDAQFHK